MSRFRLQSIRIILIVGTWHVIATMPLLAQVVPTLAPALTDTPATAPVTTLAPDLLVPLRSFTYDGTGAAIASTALSPEVYSSDPSPALVETDPAIRDSLQAGQASPFNQTGARINPASLALRDSIGGSHLLTPDENESIAGTHRASSDADSDLAFGTTKERNDQSHWGTGSSFGAQARFSNWGVKVSPAVPMGLTTGATGEMDASLDDRSARETGFASARSQRQGSSRFTARRETVNQDFRSIQGENQRNTRISSGHDWNSGSGLGSQVPSQSASKLPLSQGAGTPAASQTLAQLLQFSPGSSSGFVFGASPFSSPAGGQELSFFNPSILAVRPISLPQPSSAARQRRSRETWMSSDQLSTSATHYGINSPLASAYPHRTPGRRTNTTNGDLLTDGSDGTSFDAK